MKNVTGQLLSATQIGQVPLRNRIAFIAPTPAYAGMDENANRPTQDLAAYWEYLARGGVGLLITEPQSVHPSSTAHPRTVENVSDDIVAPYRLVADAVHDGGGKIFGHLWHAGFLGGTGYRNLPLWAPSVVRAPMGALVPAGGGALPYAMSRDDIAELTLSFAAAAARLAQATFDGVEVNAANGFLLAEFLSPKVNLRQDEYGGSLENRCRFVVEILKAVREAVGPGRAVGVRLSADPYIEPGLVESDLPAIAQHLSGAAQIDYINVLPALLPDASFPEGSGADVALAVRKAAGVPVIYNGMLTDPTVAESLVESGLELVGMTRAIMADPQLPLKVEAGRPDQIRRCIGCNQTCAGGAAGMMGMMTPYCMLNPAPAVVDGLARAKDGTGRKLLVIGAGIAGLEAARIGQLRGFAVTVWERDDDLGGQVRLIANMPQRAVFREAFEYYRRQLAEVGVELQFGREATIDAVDSFNPDVVVVATGSKPAEGPWTHPSGNGATASAALDVHAVLAGKGQLGKRVIIAMAEVDQGYHALPLAEMLADAGHEVTVVSSAFEPCLNQDFFTSEQLYRRLLRKQVRFETGTEVTSVSGEDVHVRNVFTHRTSVLSADSVVASYSGVADDSLLDRLQARRTNVYAAGDCVSPRDITGAISDVMRVMQEIRTEVPV